MLVGREKELHLLHDIQNDDSSHFVAVYGRRRPAMGSQGK